MNYHLYNLIKVRLMNSIFLNVYQFHLMNRYLGRNDHRIYGMKLKVLYLMHKMLPNEYNKIIITYLK